MTQKKRILLLDAYDAASHRLWREQLIAGLDQYQWTSLVLSPRYFNWRIRGNSLIWGAGDYPELEAEYDLIIATSMVDWACLKGLRTNLSQTPCLLYFHENQFAYPVSEHAKKQTQNPRIAEQRLLEPMLVNLYSALAADALVFNSAYNCDSFLSGVARLLAKFPDLVPKGIVDKLRAKSCELAVPLPLSLPLPSTTASTASAQISPPPYEALSQKRLQLVWNHRWEYDKGPERLLYFIKAMQARGVDFSIDIIGQQFRHQPSIFEHIKTQLKPHQLGLWGFVEDTKTYQGILNSADVVLSTALHDFQGLSVLQASCAHCLPLVPRRLAYPQWLDEFCYDSVEIEATPDELEHEAWAAVDTLISFYQSQAHYEQLHLGLSALREALSFATLAPKYAALIESSCR